MTHVIKYAESRDGMDWPRDGSDRLDFPGAGEYALSRPCVLKEEGRYRMWYSYRGEELSDRLRRIGDGRSWERDDEPPASASSESGWDSESDRISVCVRPRRKRYMLYNGNGYGKTGFGLAVLDRDDGPDRVEPRRLPLAHGCGDAGLLRGREVLRAALSRSCRRGDVPRAGGASSPRSARAAGARGRAGVLRLMLKFEPVFFGFSRSRRCWRSSTHTFGDRDPAPAERLHPAVPPPDRARGVFQSSSTRTSLASSTAT